VTGIGKHALEAASLPRPPVGYDHTHVVDGPNTRRSAV
jgi:hypothetical protein